MIEVTHRRMAMQYESGACSVALYCIYTIAVLQKLLEKMALAAHCWSTNEVTNLLFDITYFQVNTAT